MLKELVKLANHLDRIGKIKEADFIDNLLKNAEEEITDGLKMEIKNVMKQCGKENIKTENIRSVNQDSLLKTKLQEGLNKHLSYGYRHEITVSFSDTLFGFENPLDQTKVGKYEFIDEGNLDKEAIANFFGIEKDKLFSEKCYKNINIPDVGDGFEVYFAENFNKMYIIEQRFKID